MYLFLGEETWVSSAIPRDKVISGEVLLKCIMFLFYIISLKKLF